MEEVNFKFETFLSGGDMKTGCTSRLLEKIGAPGGGDTSGEACSAPAEAENRKVDPPPAQPTARASRARLKQELRPASTFVIHARTAGKRGRTCGEAHLHSRHADAVVELALALHEAGAPARRIARELGIARRTLRSWLCGTRRAAPMRLVATRRPPGFALPVLLGPADLQERNETTR